MAAFVAVSVLILYLCVIFFSIVDVGVLFSTLQRPDCHSRLASACQL